MLKLRPCRYCKTPFEPPFKRGCPENYCSDSCRKKQKALWSRKRNAEVSKRKLEAIHQCLDCGSAYRRSEGFVKYCSERCRARSCRRSQNSKRRAAVVGSECGRKVDLVPLHKRDLGLCGICKNPVDLSLRGTYADGAPEVDHIIPISRGGHHADYNLQIAHRKCNLDKGNKISSQDLAKAKALNPDWKVEIKQAKRSARKLRTNKSGVTGVYWDQSKDRWISKIYLNGRPKILGRFQQKEDAIEARKAAEKIKCQQDQRRI